MYALQLTMVLLFTYPPDKGTPDVGWVGKLVILKNLNVRMAPLEDKGDPTESAPLLGMDYRVLADKDERVQVKTAQGVTGWIKKSDVVTLEDSVTFFSTRIQENPSDADAYNRRAICWRLKGEHDAAIKDLSESLRLNPNAAIYNNRAIVYQSKKDYDSALADYGRAIQLSPQYAMAYNNRGSLWNARKEFDKAIEDLSAAIRIDPKHAMAIRNRGHAWYGKKDYDRAIEDFQRVLDIDPLNAPVHIDRGNSRAGKKEYDKALADFNQALKLDPKSSAAHNSIAWLLATSPDPKLRDGKRAVELAKTAVALSKNSAHIIDTLAAAHAEAGDFAEAVRRQEEALRDPAFKNDATARERLELYKKMQPYRQPD